MSLTGRVINEILKENNSRWTIYLNEFYNDWLFTHFKNQDPGRIYLGRLRYKHCMNKTSLTNSVLNFRKKAYKETLVKLGLEE